MLKYYDTMITFQEVPDEISLCINFVGCSLHCPGCHSPWLQGNEGKPFYMHILDELVINSRGITCVCFMGGNVTELQPFFRHVRDLGLKVAYYTGLVTIPVYERVYLDYLKLGPYDEKAGPLTSSTTNQRFYKRSCTGAFEDITHLFCKDTL